MEKQFVTYEIALKLKDLGFNEDCLAFTDDKSLFLGDVAEYIKPCIKVPLWQQVIDWLREEYNIHIYIDFYDDLYGFAIKLNNETFYNRYGSFEPGFKTYEEARENAILKAIELIIK